MPTATLEFFEGTDIEKMQETLKVVEPLIKRVWAGLGKDFAETDVCVKVGYRDEEFYYDQFDCFSNEELPVLRMEYMERGREFARLLAQRLRGALKDELGSDVPVQFTIVPTGCWGEDPVWSVRNDPEEERVHKVVKEAMRIQRKEVENKAGIELALRQSEKDPPVELDRP